MPHSPTPWTAGSDEDSHIVFDAELNLVCDVSLDGGDVETEEANALLIAAAPDLLEALRGVLRVADRNTVEFDAARAAIAKATA